ncbi:MAG: hypothetical protein WBW80_20905 [Acidimicrobiales bacterium]
MPKRTFWLTAGVALGAGSTLWAERRVRRTIEQTAAKLSPDALVAEVGRTARHVAESAGDRFRDAYSEGRDQMHRHEEQLWSGLAERGITLSTDGLPAVAGSSSAIGPSNAVGSSSAVTSEAADATSIPAARSDDSTRAARRRPSRTARRRTARRAKSPSHLGN